MQQKEKSYFRFNAYGLSSWAEKALWKIRSEIFRIFSHAFKIDSKTKVLDVGVSADDHPASNFFEKLYPHTKQLTAVGLGDFEELENIYPGLKYRKVNGVSLPFRNEEFDIVFSHAVVEHVGSREKQAGFLQELIRVSKSGVFFTTPSRSHFLELHTGLPLIHYLPQSLARRIYKLLGKGFYSSEDNLNLLYAKDIHRLLAEAQVARYDIHFVKWLGMTSNLIVIIHKAQISS